MAHPTIKIDTNIQANKRAHPEDNDEGFEVLDGPEQDDPGLEAGDTESVPPFLCQSVLEIHQKFEELEWMQRARLAEGMLANDPSHRWALEADPEVKARNRYVNVQAWANSRIHLRVPDGECDFINASPIVLKDSVSEEERKYIATQGPKVGNIAHFWHMVFHETKEIGVIVMLTQTFESGREKCSQYFPLNSESSLVLLRADESDPFMSNEDQQTRDENIVGQVALIETTFDEKSRSEIRKLRLTLGTESKVVWHYLFAGWADYSKPEGDDRNALLHLIEQSGSKSTPDNPRIVHCSAGVGRTGTFIALDHLLLELQSGRLLQAADLETDPVFETVDQMREQRMMMVYNEMQLQFIYEVLREQTDRKLGKVSETNGRKSDERSSKMAKLSTEPEYLPSSKPELEPVHDRTATPNRSWSGTPEVSDNE
ncbi:protein-tyrosine phosphatase-like protein [Aspergillus leporis]|uniref:Protein-tyrosine phosphatase-like protein n=1 Tax=Aspergillus leporis TaxID=41062 RepID=A0A5N5WWS8_9EURO|nr:protein-tyrosine phosphatase-like protein [Aspergillus leporis]